MNILIVTQTVDVHDPVLGFFHRWIEEFATQCESVTVLCLQEGDHTFPRNVRVVSLGKEQGASRATYLTRFYKTVWQERRAYDSVFVHMNPVYVVLGGVLWRMLGKRVCLWYTHGTVTMQLRLATMLTHTVVTASAKSFRIASKKVHVVGHGIDSEQFAFRDNVVRDAPKLVTVGRISKTKRQDVALATLNALHARGILAELTIVGTPLTGADRVYDEELRNKVAKWKLGTYVHWVGSVPNSELPALLQKQDLFIHTSETGSLDKVALEAMAVGVVLVTTSAAIQAVLPTGYQDEVLLQDPETLATYIESLPETDQQSMMKLGREYVVQHHSLSELTAKIIATIAR